MDLTAAARHDVVDPTGATFVGFDDDCRRTRTHAHPDRVDKVRPEHERAIKDSFQSLELNSLGFKPLFDAEWIAMSLPPPDLKGHPAAEYRSARVTSKAGLIAWEQAWAGEGVNAATIYEPRVFKPRLLADTNDRLVFMIP